MQATSHTAKEDSGEKYSYYHLRAEQTTTHTEKCVMVEVFLVYFRQYYNTLQH